MFYCLSSFRSSSFAFCFRAFVFDIYVYIYRYTVLSYIVVIFHVFLAILFILLFAIFCVFFVFVPVALILDIFFSMTSCYIALSFLLFFLYYCPFVFAFSFTSHDSFSGFPLISKPGGFVFQARTDYNGVS